MKVKCILFLVIWLPAALCVRAQDAFTNGLVAYYPFNGNADDESGNGRDGIVQGATIDADRFGRPLNAYRFDDVDDGIRIGASPVTNQLTIAAWILKEGDSTNHDQIVCVTNEGGVYLNIYPIQNPTIHNHIDFGANYHTSDRYFSPDPIPLNTWVHIVASYDGQNVRLFQNGQLVAEAARTGGFSAGTMYIGRDGGDSTPIDVFRGSIDDVRIYDRALSTSEVSQLYEYERAPRLKLKMAVKPSFSNLWVGTNYQLQLSGNLSVWTNNGLPFTATNWSMDYPQYWDVDNLGSLFFRLQVVP
jgi:hypothetical protein